jgi:hypothetical protein
MIKVKKTVMHVQNFRRVDWIEYVITIFGVTIYTKTIDYMDGSEFASQTPDQ